MFGLAVSKEPTCKIYRPETSDKWPRVKSYPLKLTKIVSFPDQQKLLKEVVFGLAVSKEPTCKIYRSETSDKWPRVKSYPLKYATIKNLQYQHCPEI